MAKRLLIQGTTWWLLLCLLAAGWLLPGCRQEENNGATAATAAIRIGLMAPLTGLAEEQLGQQMVNSARQAVQAINDAGGLLVDDQRFFVILIVANDANNPETAVSAAQRLINQEQVVAIVGPPFDNTAVPVATVAERAGIPMISPTSTHPDTTAQKEFVFRATFTDAVQGAALARFALEEQELQQAAALFNAAPAENEVLAEAFGLTFKRGGGSVVALESYDEENGQPLNLLLGQVRDTGADVLFLPGAAEDVLLSGRRARELGLNATLLGSSSWESKRLYAEPAFEGSFFSSHFCPERAPESFAAFAEQYAAAYGQEPGSLAALTFDTLGLIYEAIQSETKFDPDSIRQGLYNSRYVGVTGSIFFNNNGNPERDVAIWHVTQGTAVCVQMVAAGERP
jgi:branched-chain amino acid transport system substrate-binding protein